MTGISFVISTSGTNDDSVNQIIDSIEVLSIPSYEVIVVGGRSTSIKRKNVIHIPFNENIAPTPWITRKKNLGAELSQYDVVVVSNDYYAYDPDWYIEFEKFGTDWDICVQQNLTVASQGSIRANGWRVGGVPGYPEIPAGMPIPWDIDCFVPYMAIHGAFWVAKRDVMLEQPLDETLFFGQAEDIEWSSRVVPGWLGQKPHQCDYKVVSNPNCITRLLKEKPPYPGNPNWESISYSLSPLWNFLRKGGRRPGVYHYDSTQQKISIS